MAREEEVSSEGPGGRQEGDGEKGETRRGGAREPEERGGDGEEGASVGRGKTNRGGQDALVWQHEFYTWLEETLK